MPPKIVEKEVLSPLGEIENNNIQLNSFPDDFEKVALVDNTKPGANIILGSIKNFLGNRDFIDVKKPAGAPANSDQIRRARDSNLAILALGDCGSCTSWVILDAIRLEKAGIPTISVCSDHFSPFAHELATSHGLKDIRILEVKHPIAGLTKNEIEDKSIDLINPLKYLLQIP